MGRGLIFDGAYDQNILQTYRKLPLIGIGLIQLHKGFLGGLINEKGLGH